MPPFPSPQVQRFVNRQSGSYRFKAVVTQKPCLFCYVSLCFKNVFSSQKPKTPVKNRVFKTFFESLHKPWVAGSSPVFAIVCLLSDSLIKRYLTIGQSAVFHKCVGGNLSLIFGDAVFLKPCFDDWQDGV